MLAPRKRVWNRPSAGHQRIARLPDITQSWKACELLIGEATVAVR